MGIVLEIGLSKNKGEKIKSVTEVEAISGKGLISDRKFKTSNDKKSQITLIEIENINYYNNITKTNIPPLDFRRNIVTQNIRLNGLIGQEFFVGTVKLKAHDLCRPCKYLQEKLKADNFVKELLHRAGLRCEILTSGKIKVGDIIKLKND